MLFILHNVFYDFFNRTNSLPLLNLPEIQFRALFQARCYPPKRTVKKTQLPVETVVIFFSFSVPFLVGIPIGIYLTRCTCPFLFVSVFPRFIPVWLSAGRVTSLNIVSRALRVNELACDFMHSLVWLEQAQEVPPEEVRRECGRCRYYILPYKKNRNRWLGGDLYTVHGVLNAALFLTFSLFVFTLLWLNNLFTRTNKQTEQRRCSQEPRPVRISSSACRVFASPSFV